MKQNYEKFNLKETLLVNIFWMFHIGVILVIVFEFIDLIQTFDNENTALLGAIIMVFGIIKLISWVKSPKICFKTKKGKLTDCYY